MPKEQHKSSSTQKSQNLSSFVRTTKHVTSLKFKSFELTNARSPGIEQLKMKQSP